MLVRSKLMSLNSVTPESIILTSFWMFKSVS